MQAFTEVLEDDDESEASVLGNKDQTMFGYSAARKRADNSGKTTTTTVQFHTVPVVGPTHMTTTG